MDTFFNPVNKREYNFLKVGVYWMCQYIKKMKLFKPKFLTFGSLLMTSVLWTDRKHTKDQHTLLLEIWKHWILSLYLVTCSSFTWFFYLMNQRSVFPEIWASTFINPCWSSKWDQILCAATVFEIHADAHFLSFTSLLFSWNYIQLVTYMATLQIILCIDFLYQTVF